MRRLDLRDVPRQTPGLIRTLPKLRWVHRLWLAADLPISRDDSRERVRHERAMRQARRDGGAS